MCSIGLQSENNGLDITTAAQEPHSNGELRKGDASCYKVSFTQQSQQTSMFASQAPARPGDGGHHWTPDTPQDTVGGRTRTRSAGTAVHRLYRTGLLCLGVMCIIQATLNVVLRILSSVAQDNSTDQTNKEDQVQNFFKNLTAEKDQLETIYKQLQRERDQLQTRYEQLRRERDQSNAQMRTCEENFQRLKASTCPSGWVTIGSSIYYVSMTTNTWSLSRKDCEERGADLVVINSREEQDFIRGLAVHVWIGLMETDSVWTWVDGTSLSTRCISRF
ncbi:uncharacterized protein LOC143520969 isoform X2 [Brachyhypopomus gauderio]|uniref:uncharacterized protein LOC143520969 isoform X2 n=1 Tax=Brachyhypopomus gauderio TaxID=698409 RepID=UPI004042F0C8